MKIRQSRFFQTVRAVSALAGCFWVAARCGAATLAEVAVLSTVANTPITFPITRLSANPLPGSGGSPNATMTVESVSSISVQGGTVVFVPEGVAVWTNRYDGLGKALDGATDLVLDGNGTVYVTGFSTGPGSQYDYVTIKYLSDGAAVWTNRFDGNGTSSDTARHVAVDGNGDIYVTGDSGSPFGTSDYVTIKYSANGTALWTNRYNGRANSYDFPSGLVVDGSGNVYVAGYSVRFDPNGRYDYATVKYRGDGMPLWTNFYNGPAQGNDVANTLGVDASGNVYVAGYSVGTDLLGDFATLKYGPDGTSLWTNRYEGLGQRDDAVVALKVDDNGNVYVTGYAYGSRSENTYSYDYVTIKYLANGLAAWTNSYNGPANTDDFAAGLAIDKSGSVYVTGYSYNPYDLGMTNADYATIKYLPDGTAVWTNRYHSPGHVSAFAKRIAVDHDGNAYVTGYADFDLDAGRNRDSVTVKYDSAGTAVWTNRYDGIENGSDSPGGIAIDGHQNVFVAGSSGNATNSDYVTIKYSGGKEITYLPPNNFSGTDTFTCVFRDSGGQVATGTVSVLVGVMPAALHVQRGIGTVTLQWATNLVGYTLEASDTCSSPNSWVTFGGTPLISGSNLGLSLPATNASRFFRLRSP